MLSPEEKLLLALCRLEFTEEEKREFKSLAEKVSDWDKFVKISNEHGIIALSAFNLKETHLDHLVPEEQMRMLNDGLMQSMIRNAWLSERWKEVNQILTEAGIKHILLKGMALEHTVYGSKGLRQMTDNDILLKKKDAVNAWYLLQKNGFVPDNFKSALHRKIITDIGKHLPTLVKDGYAVEIHTKLFNEPAKNSNLHEYIDKASEIGIDGTMGFILNDDMHLEYLSEHNQDHIYGTGPELRLFLDISLLKRDNYISIKEDILSDPEKFKVTDYRKITYKKQFFELPYRSRLRFLAGDIFPSLRWMKQRHGCGWPKVLAYYPRRMGKLMWLITRYSTNAERKHAM